MKNLAKFLIFISSFVQVANATTYYISTNGSDNNPGTSGSPFLTLGKAETVVVAGDVVTVAAGTYTLAGLTMSHSGSGGNPITFQSSGNVTLNLTTDGLLVTGAWRVITGFSFTGAFTRAIWLQTGNNIVQNVTVTQARTVGYGIQVGRDANTGGEAADNNTLNNVRVIGTGTGGTIHGIIFGGGGSGNVLKNSYVSNTYYGIVDKAEVSSLIYNNVFNLTAANLYTCIYDKGSTGSSYYNNICRPSGGGFCMILADGDGATPHATSAVIKNNIFIKSSDPAIFINDATESYTIDYNCFQYTSGTIVYNHGSNINSLASWQSASGQDAHSIASTPTFTNASGTLSTITDYKPTSGSPVIDAGIAISGRATDAANNAINGTTDIGPYEFGGSPGVANKPPAANAGPDQSFFFPTNSTTLTGTGTDADGTISSYQWTKIQGPAQYDIASPTLAKTNISNLDIGVYVFELTVTDNSGATAKDAVQITVNASSNQPPVAKAGNSISIVLPTNSGSLDGSGSSDADGTIISYKWTKVFGPSSFAIADPTLQTTNVTSLVQGTYQFELMVTDDKGAVGKDTVEITVSSSPNQGPSANAGPDMNITLPTSSVTLSGSANDPDGTIASYQWSKVSGPSQYSIASATQEQTGVNNLTQGIYEFELEVTDNSGASATDIVWVTVNGASTPPSNQAPTANAGPDINITLPNNTVTLSGSGTDPDGSIASYQWTKFSGPSQYTISSATQEQTSVNNLTQGIYKFELKVTDDSGASAWDTVWVTVNVAGNVAPKANAGPDITITLPTSSVTLSGSGSDPDGTLASYKWVSISGPTQSKIMSPTRASTTVSNLAQGVYKFQLTVTDNAGASAKDTVQVTVNAAAPVNPAPKANAGADVNITLPTNSATLSGSGSDPDGKISSYRWRKISGPSQYNIASPTKGQTSINNLAQGAYKFELTVTDNGGKTGSDTVQVTVSAAAAVAPNKVPVANAGLDINISLPTNSVTLTGSGSDADGSITAYKWTKISGPSQFNIVASTKAQTSVSNLAQGIYAFELTVTDNWGATASDIIQVTVNGAPPQTNQSPKANAGSNLVITLPTNSVTLTGSGTDADGTIASYQWSKVSGPSQYSIVSSTKAQTIVNNLVEGIYQFALTVTDHSGAAAKATVQVTVNKAVLLQNQIPEASAGLDEQIMLPMDTVTLSGSGSDDDGTIAGYKWTKISGPLKYTLVSPSRSRTLVRDLVEGVYQFELAVTDNRGAVAKDTVALAVISAPKTFAKVFPNPATDVVNIQIEATPQTSNAALRIYDNKGILVYQEDFVRQQQGMIKQVNVSKLPTGIYFAELQTGTNDIVALRFMKK